jgi:HEAT repeat protein
MTLWKKLFGRKKAVEPNVEELKEKRDIEGLIKALEYKGDEGSVRFEAAEALMEIGSKRAIEPLIQALNDEDPVVREDVVLALARMGGGGKRAVGPLIQALNDEVSEVREHVPWALGAIGDKRAVEPLIQALNDEDSEVRKGAAWALGNIGDKRAVEPLTTVLGDKEEVIREKATEALKKLSQKGGVDEQVAVNSSLIPQAVSEYDTNEEEKTTAEIQKSGVEHLTVKPNVEELKEKKDVEGLINALGYRRESVKMDDVVVRSYAAEALGGIDDERAVEPLIKALQDKAWDVSYTVIEALGNIADPRAIEPIKQCVIETDEERVRGRGIIVLDEIFDLANAELKETFLASKADEKAKKVSLGIITEDKEPRKKVEGVTFVKKKYREDNMFGIPVKNTYVVYTAKNKEQARKFIKTKSVNKKHYYIEVNVGDVDDPEGIVGVDINGIYEI